MSSGTAEIDLSEDELRGITRYAVACARRALSVFEDQHPADPRPREAIEGAEAFADGQRRTAALRAKAWAAWTAAREAEGPAAADAARAASMAAGAAYLHPLATPHQVRHVLGSAIHSARALELAAGGDEGVGQAHLRWAVDHAPVAVRDVLGRLPSARAGQGRSGELLRALDAALRG